MTSISPDILITGASAVASAFVSGLFVWLASRNSDRVLALRDQVRSMRAGYIRALEQVEAFHTEESLFASQLEGRGAWGNANGVKTEFRNRVEVEGFQRPTMTAGEARRLINEAKAGSF